MPITVTTVTGDLLDQPVDAIVNAWNRNIIPWWLLLPSGVSGAIKRRAGVAPFIEVGTHGPIPLGGAVLTGAGRLPYIGIIHVAGISGLWLPSEYSISSSIKNAVAIALREGYNSLATPLIGAGTGGFPADRVEAVMRTALADSEGDLSVLIVRYSRGVVEQLY